MDAAWKKIVSRKHISRKIDTTLSVERSELIMGNGLLVAVNVFVTREESSFFPEDTLYMDVETGLYTAQVTMTHDLHCLNMLRKSGYPEYYPEMQTETLRGHLDHCIDALRESIMCAGDMTLIPVVWSANRNWIIPNFKTSHTCRDPNTLLTWAQSRDAEDPKKFVETSERYKKTGSFLKNI
ncbi:hypothetical protein BX600DRAFT_507313 [Xylariales sp. PMI_506]|nr:hypothetical protein BX600DRAFT_507313 [Xylariales sp. PMI_506]